MRIKNIIGSSKVSAKPKNFDSWLQFWEHFAGLNLTRNKYWKCPACGESLLGSRFDGCHVQKADSTDQKWYIACIIRPIPVQFPEVLQGTSEA